MEWFRIHYFDKKRWGLDTDQSIPVGTGFFVDAKTATNITFVGNVVVPSQGVGTNVNVFGAGSFELVGSQIPYSGDLNQTSGTNLTLGAVLPNKSQVEVWNGSGFTTSTKSGGTWTPNATINVAQGVFVVEKQPPIGCKSPPTKNLSKINLELTTRKQPNT